MAECCIRADDWSDRLCSTTGCFAQFLPRLVLQHRQLAGQTRNGVESTPVAGRLLGASALAPFTCHAARPAVVRPLGKPPQQGASAQQPARIAFTHAITPASWMDLGKDMLDA